MCVCFLPSETRQEYPLLFWVYTLGNNILEATDLTHKQKINNNIISIFLLQNQRVSRRDQYAIFSLGFYIYTYKSLLFICGTCDPTKSLENLFGIYKRNKECGDKPNKLGSELLLCDPLYIYNSVK